MACSVCNHTMSNLGSPERRIFWCPRCGTLREYTGDFQRVEMPMNLDKILQAARLLLAKKRVDEVAGIIRVDAHFEVRHADEESPLMELVVFGPNGRRIA